MKKEKKITLNNVAVHNLKNVSLTLDMNKLIAFTGVSGSGKSSLAFDTLFIEGQKRYIDSLSKNAKRGLGKLPSPKADSISSLPPTVAIEQKTLSHNPRSTVGTITNLYDHLRLFFSHLATPYCPVSHEKVSPTTEKEIKEAIFSIKEGEKLIFLAPFAKQKKGAFKDDLQNLLKKGFIKVYIDKEFYDLSESIPVLDKEKSHTIDLVIDRVIIKNESSQRVEEAISASLKAGNGVFSILLHKAKQERVFSLYSYSPKSGIYYKSLENEDFSFNHPKGMCEKCRGIGICEDFDLSKIINENKSIKEDCCLIAPHYNTVRYSNIYKNLGKIYGFSISKPFKKLSKEAKEIFLHGTEEKWVKMQFTHPETGYRWSDYVEWKGVIGIAKERISNATTDLYKNKMRALMDIYPCTSCHGSKLKPYPSAAKFGNKTIAQWTSLSIDELKDAIVSIKLTKKEEFIAKEILKEMLSRINFLQDVGLNYLSLDRVSPTLSGGESQRVRLSSLIGSSLTDVLYILDEPSIGLHPKDNLKLIKTLQKLRDVGNTVIVVEHDEDTILSADTIVDIGPKAGIEGGEILFNGDRDDFLQIKNSLTADYLTGKKEIAIPKKRKVTFKECIEITGASHHNLKNQSVKIPLQVMTAVTGISGSGKSSLITETLYPYLNNKLHKSSMFVGKNKTITGEQYIEKVVSIDQSPIGRTPRSNPATYIGVFTDIRKFFTMQPSAIALGFNEGRFSFNVKEGSCSLCSGMGLTKVDMDFLADVWVKCTQCHGKRFTSDTLSISYKGKNIYDVLEMPISSAATFFEKIPKIHKKLSLLCQMGLGYITLGQSATTLSGGEAQRIKLCCELLKKKSSKTLYILDEPTTGLHFSDINKLLKILQSLVAAGNSIIVIEHNMDLVKTCDYVIDLGPEGGKKGGEICAKGTIEEVAKKKSPTAPFLKKALLNKKKSVVKKAQERASDNKTIKISGACEHNLKNLSLEIKKEEITVFTGPSGSGKSSLAYNTIFSEAQRRFVETLPPFSRRFIKALPKPKYDKIDSLPPVVAVEQKMRSMNPRSTLGTVTEIYDYLRLIYTHLGKPYCPETNYPIVEIDSSYIANQYDHLEKPTKIIVLAPINTKEIKDFEEWKKTFLASGFLRIRLNGKMYELDEKIPYRRLLKNTLDLVVDRIVYTKENKKRLISSIDLGCKYSSDEVVLLFDDNEDYYNLSFSVKETGKSYPKITHRTFSFNHKEGMCESCSGLGVLIDVSEELFSVFGCKNEEKCPDCDGGRLNPLASNVLVGEVSLPDLCNYSLEDFLQFIKNLKKSSTIKEPIKNILSATTFLADLGLDYLCLSRMTRTLSGGEIQRMRLAKELHKDLTGACYILDEPTVGLHPENNEMLNKTLLNMKMRGNTIIIVEHDPLTMKIADKIFDFGPVGGKDGGQIVASGSFNEIKKSKTSVTGPFLANKKELLRKTPLCSVEKFIKVENINVHNIENLNVSIPAEKMTVFTGVSGAGKTSLVIDCLYKHLVKNLKRRRPKKTLKTENGTIYGADSFEKVLHIDRTRVSYSSRSDVSTYLDLLTPLRTFFSKLPDAHIQGLKPGAFSFNHKSGSCKRCMGHGHEWIDLQFLPPIKVTCESCKGKRLNPLSLSVKYKGYSISDLLALDAPEALKIFPKIPKIKKILKILKDTGLDHLCLNRKVKTLSGGEGSRLKIARELLQKDFPPTLYIFDEPTSGLHFSDLTLLLNLFDSLIKKNHCIWIIEHNTDIIKNADHVIDLGPGGGKYGGKICDNGSVEEIIKRKKALIARYLV